MRYFCLIISILCTSISVHSQFIFNNLTLKDGLSSKETNCIFKDEEGFVWIGTRNGLDRFDGSVIRPYNHLHNKFLSFTSEFITEITEYGRGKIFIGTNKQAGVYNKISDSLSLLYFLNQKKDTIHDVSVTKLIKEGSRLWIATNAGLFVCSDPDDNTALPASSYLKDTLLDKKNIIGGACVWDSVRKGIWLGTYTGLYFIDQATRIISSSLNNPDGLPIFDNNYIVSLALDDKNNMWVSNRDHPLAYFNFADHTFRDRPWFSSDTLFSTRGTVNLLYWDRQNRLWIANSYGKIFVYDRDSSIIILPDQSPELYKLPVGMFKQAYTDVDGNIWLSTINGVSQLSTTQPLKKLIELPGNLPKPYSQESYINGFKRAGDKLWWVCKYDGLFLLNEITGEAKAINPNDQPLKYSSFFDITKIGDDWWCSTSKGIQLLDMKTRQFRPFTNYPPGHTITKSVVWIYEDQIHDIWIGAWNDAIYRYTPSTKKCIRFDGTDPQYGDISTGVSFCYHDSKDGKLWFGTNYKGLRVYDMSTHRFSNPVPEKPENDLINKNVVFSIVEDSHHNIYAGAFNGIFKLTGSECKLLYTTKNGLPTNRTTNLFIDSLDYIWTTYDEDVYYLKPGSDQFLSFKINTAMPYSNDDWSYYKVENKTLYITIANKLGMISMDIIHCQPANHPPLITGVSVFEKQIPFSIQHPEINLTPDQNYIVFEFSANSGVINSQAQYAYKLEGYDKDWVYCGKRRSAAYTKLPDGNYHFLVKSTSERGEWNDLVTVVNLHIAPPFYKKLWFIMLLILAGIGIIYWIYRLRQNRRRKKYISKTIDYFANSVYGENSVNEICWDIARNCISQLRLEDCVVYLYDKEKGKLVQKAAYGPKNPKGHEIMNPIEITPGEGIVGTVAATAKALLINDTTKDSRYIVDDERRFSEISVPIMHDNKLMGVIDSEHSRKNFFTEQHLKALTTIASISSNKIAEAQAEELAKLNEIRLLEINKMLAESQLMALRAQMNPHFVFNCLNSIQECIVTEKYGEASRYLNKFSRLFRMVLNNSGRNLVSIDDEKEVLELYLELEHMRFEKAFEYEITVDESLETDEILIPSMLLQPFVENALWHGLMHKEGNRRLDINFTRMSEDIFQCIIDDNGIGRKKSFDLKQQQSKAKRHESKGLKISQDRLDLLQKQGQHAAIRIIDKVENETPTGTKIIIELSTYLKNT